MSINILFVSIKANKYKITISIIFSIRYIIFCVFVWLTVHCAQFNVTHPLSCYCHCFFFFFFLVCVLLTLFFLRLFTVLIYTIFFIMTIHFFIYFFMYLIFVYNFMFFSLSSLHVPIVCILWIGLRAIQLLVVDMEKVLCTTRATLTYHTHWKAMRRKIPTKWDSKSGENWFSFIVFSFLFCVVAGIDSSLFLLSDYIRNSLFLFDEINFIHVFNLEYINRKL